MRVFLSVKKVTKTNAFLKSFKKRTKEILLKMLLLSIIGTPYTLEFPNFSKSALILKRTSGPLGLDLNRRKIQKFLNLY